VGHGTTFMPGKNHLGVNVLKTQGPAFLNFYRASCYLLQKMEEDLQMQMKSKGF
jgi:hypothetical protein